MSKDFEKTICLFVEGDRLEAKAVRDSAGFQHGGIIRLSSGKIVSGRASAAKINPDKTYGLIAAAVAKSGSGVTLDMDSEGLKTSAEGSWIMVGSNGTRISAATCASVRIDEYATEMLKDPHKVREFFKRVNGEAKAR
ncbi:hypothetical protein [Pseudomonas sp.]|uniref:hypothetical protein n=1 Tax=Pseudomonas sp. TaxID=306 RepID=UPI003F318041